MATSASTASPHPQSQPQSSSHVPSMSMDFDLDNFSLQQSLDDFALYGINANTSGDGQHPVSMRAGPSSTGADGSVTQPSPVPSRRDPSAHPSPATASRTPADHARSASAGPSTASSHGLGSDLPDGGHSLQQIMASLQASSSGQSADNQMNVNDIQRLLAEKEQAARLQNLQTALLKQQLEAMQRGEHPQQQQQQQQQQPQQQQTMPSTQQQQQQQSIQQLLSLLQMSNAQTNDGQARSPPAQADQSNGNQGNADTNQLLATLMKMQTNRPNDLPKLLADSNVLAQYGLITPPSSGGFNLLQGSHLPLQISTSGGIMSAGSTSTSSPSAHVQPYASPINMPLGSMAPGSNFSTSTGGTAGSFSSSGASGTGYSVWDNSLRHPYTPAESPAVTPASVFSNMSLGNNGAGDQFFSPLTSPALHPQPPYHVGAGGVHGMPPPHKHHKHKGHNPSASPMTLQGKSGPLPRKNRSTTAEARANRQRPSPMIKPTLNSSGSSAKRPKKDSASQPQSPGIKSGVPSTASSRRTSVSEDAGASGPSGPSGPSSQQISRSSSQQVSGSSSTFTPIMAGVTKPMDASPSEGASSTPSPIDISTAMGPPLSSASGKPMTPGSLMGIAGGGGGKSAGSGSSTGGSSNDADKNGSTGSLKRSSRRKSDAAGVVDAAAPTISTTPKAIAVGPSTKGKRSKLKNGSVSFAADAGRDEDDEPAGQDEDDSGNADETGPPESRRSSHKAAEQKRRDSLKYCFDELRGMLPPITLDEEAPGGSSLGPDGLTEDENAEGFDRSEVAAPEMSLVANRAISKVALLRHSNEWVIRLRNRLARRDQALASARGEIEQLRAMLMAHGIAPPPRVGDGQPHLQHLHPHHQHLNHFSQPAGVGMHAEAMAALMQQQQQQQQQHQGPTMDWH